MINDNSLYRHIFNENNIIVDENKMLEYSKLLNKLLSIVAFSFILGGLLTTFLANFISLFVYISYNEYASLILGNICFVFAFILIKKNLSLYFANNPITIIGIIYPAFFNAKLLNIGFNNLLGNTLDFYAVFLLISIIIYYLILNQYYLRQKAE
ncbi:hypothetical protein [Mycoplasma sp. P36-A1]|uniref:hypothetical protein n=1 Tax=Mycoplasma sp. P36-A1 TaxID=3252900 RepID=UPI003C2F1FC0